MDAAKILQLLHWKYVNTAEYKCANLYIFKDDWESDFFIQQRSTGYCYEVEIKISRSDFFADLKKKAKHSILQHGYFQYEQRQWNQKIGEGTTKTVQWEQRPNRFYYCVPEGLVEKSEVPIYAGLIYAYKDRLQIIKEAPFIHKRRLDLRNQLCKKFYIYWGESEVTIHRLRKWNTEQEDTVTYKDEFNHAII